MGKTDEAVSDMEQSLKKAGIIREIACLQSLIASASLNNCKVSEIPVNSATLPFKWISYILCNCRVLALNKQPYFALAP